MTTSPAKKRPERRSQPAATELAESRRQAKAVAVRRQIRNGLLAVAGIIVIGGGLLLYWWRSEANAAAAQLALDSAQASLRQAIAGFDLHDRSQAQQLLQRLESSRAQWQGWPSAAEFSDRLAKAQAAVARLQQEQAVVASMHEIAAAVAAGPKAPAEWAALHDRAVGLGAALQNPGGDLSKALAGCLDSIDHGHFAALRAAAAAANGVAAERFLATAEAVAKEGAAAAAAAHDAGARGEWERGFEDCARAADVAATQRCDANTIAAIAWQDLLPGTVTADWAHSASPGLQHAVAGPMLSIDGPDAGGGVVVLHRHAWHNCELEFDVELRQGAVTVMLRSDKKADAKAAAAVTLALTASATAVKLPNDTATHVDLLVLGSRLTARVGEQALQLPIPIHARSGGLGIITTAGTSVRLSRMHVRPLD